MPHLDAAIAWRSAQAFSPGWEPLPSAHPQRKDHQLCQQVHDCLCLVLAGSLGDPCLQALELEAVIPAPNASRLRVVFRLVDPPEGTTPRDIQEALAGAIGLLRWEIAQAVHRRRIPDLVFEILADEDAFA